MTIPRIDIGALRGTNDLEKRRMLAAEIRTALTGIGFFYVAGHGVSQACVSEAFEAAEDVFALPSEVKERYHIRHSAPNQRGYVPFFEENIDYAHARDLKEAFDFGRPLPADDPDLLAGTPFHAENVYPSELHQFKERIEAYYDEMLRLSDELIELIAESLDLPRDFFSDKMDKAIANLRLLHYPPHPENADKDVVGVGAHTDYGFLTILATDDVGGLEVQTLDGEWLDVDPEPGAFIVNIGELLANWTNDTYRATPHRVMNRAGRDRYSLPFFLDTNYHALIECIPSCVAAGEVPKYAPVIGGEYLAGRFDQTFAFRSAEDAVA